MESFGHEDVNQVFGQVVFDAQDNIDVIKRHFPLHKHNQHRKCHVSIPSTALHELTSDLAIDPPERPFGHAVQFDQRLPDPPRLQQQDELLLQLPDAHAG